MVRRWVQIRLEVALVSGVALLLAILAPFNTDQQPVWLRFAYWLMFIAYGSFLGRYASRLVFDRWALKPVWLAILATAMMISSGIYPVVLGLNGLDGDMPPLASWPTIFLFVIAITLPVTIVSYMVARLRELGTHAAPRTAADANLRAPLDAKLPLKWRGQPILAVVSEDHYLRVYSDLGEELILMRLADAVHALSAEDGLQTHRSWWVAKAGVEKVTRVGARLELTLTNGVVAPVSRSFVTNVREAGWL